MANINWSAVKLLGIHQVLHFLALLHQRKFWEHNVMQADTLGVCTRAISCIHGNRSWEIKEFHILQESVCNCHIVR